MRRTWMDRFRLVAGSIAVGTMVFGGTAHAGDLNPPPGAVAPTMKTLDDVSPWIPIDPKTAPGSPDAVVVITQSGRYRLTDSLVGQSGKHGIEIAAPSVVIDLAGFDLVGGPGTLDGIRTQGGLAFECVEIAHEGLKMQGIIRDFGGHGILIENTERASVSSVRVSSCGGDGIRLMGDDLGNISQVIVEFNVGDGIHVEGPGSAVIEVDNVSNNGGDGIEARMLNWSAVRSTVQDFEKNTENVSGGFGLIGANGANGVYVDQVERVSISNLRIENCVGDGIEAIGAGAGLHSQCEIANVEVEACGGNGGGQFQFFDCTVHAFKASDCGGDGLVLVPASGGSVDVGNNGNWTFGGGSTIKGCTGNGITVSGGSLITFTGLEVHSVGLRAIDVSTAIADRAEVRVDKFNIRQEFGPTQAGIRMDGPASIQLSNGSIRDCGTTGLFCVQYRESDFDFLSISSSGLDGIVLQPGSPGSSESTQTTLDNVSCFGSLGDNVQFNPLATAGSHRLSVSDGQFNNSAGRGISIVPQTAGLYEFELVVTDSTMSGNALDGIAFDPAPTVRATSCNVTLSGVRSTGNGGDGARFTWTQVGGPFKFTTRDGNFSHNGGHGGYVYWTSSTVRGMTFDGNGGDGLFCENSACVVEDSQANSNAGNGFRAVSASGIAGHAFVLDGSRSHDDGLVGVLVDGAPPVIISCSITGNDGGGIDIANVSGASVSECSIGLNGGFGIWSRSSVFGSSFTGNQCDNNGGAIQVDGTGNFVARNSGTAGPLGGISAAQGNLVGPLVDSSNIATECSPNSNMLR